jgi:hypothetical protein
MGSVNWNTMALSGSSPLGEIHDRMTLPNKAKVKAKNRISTNRATNSFS